MSDERLRRRVAERTRLATSKLATAEARIEEARWELDAIRDELVADMADEPQREPPPDPVEEPEPPDPPRVPAEPREEPAGDPLPSDIPEERSNGPDDSRTTWTTRRYGRDSAIRTVRAYAGWRARRADPLRKVAASEGWHALDARAEAARRESFVMLPRTVQVSDFALGARDLPGRMARRVDTGGPLKSTVLPFAGSNPLGAWTPLTGPWAPLSDTGQPVPGAAGGAWLGFHPGQLPLYTLLSAARCVGDWQTVPSRPLSALVENGRVVHEQFDLQARGAYGGGPSEQAFYPDGSRGVTDDEFASNPMLSWVGQWGNQGFDGQHYRRATWWHEALVRQYPEHAYLVAPDIRDLARTAAYYLCPYEATGAATKPEWRTNKSLFYRSWERPPSTIRQEAWTFQALALAIHVGYREEFEYVARVALAWAKSVALPSGAFQLFGVDEGSPAPRLYGVRDGEKSQADIEWPMILPALASLSLVLDDEIPDWLRDAISKAAFAYLDCWPVGKPQNTPKYWVVQRGSQMLASPEPCPGRSGDSGRGGDGYNFGVILELAERFGSRSIQGMIRARRGEILDVFESDPKKRPWWAGIAGALSRA